MSAVVKDSIAKLNQEQGKPWRLPRDNRETFTMAIHVNLRFVKCNWKLGKDAKKKNNNKILEPRLVGRGSLTKMEIQVFG